MTKVNLLKQPYHDKIKNHGIYKSLVSAMSHIMAHLFFYALHFAFC